MKKGRRILLQVVGSAALSLLLAMLLWNSGVLTVWENKVWDLQSRSLATPSPYTGEITLVLLDQGSIEWVQENMGLSWPWPRELYGAIIHNLNRYQPKAIGFDVLFTEPSTFGVADDRALGNAIAETKYFAAGTVFPAHQGKHRSWPEGTPFPPLRLRSNIPAGTLLPEYSFLTMPITELAEHATVLCNVHHDPDPDGIYRAIDPVVMAAGVPLPALGLGMYLLTTPNDVISLKKGWLSVGSCNIPIDEKGRALLRFRGGTGTFNRISAASLLREEMRLRDGGEEAAGNGDLLKDRYILFGFSAPGLFDLRPTPVDAISSGVEINATLLDNLLNNDFITPLSRFSQQMVIFCTALALGMLCVLFSSPVAMTAISLFFLLIPPLLSFVLFFIGYRFEVLPFEITIAGTISLHFVVSYMHEGRQRRFIKHSFAHYLSPHVIEQLIQEPERLQLGGDRKELTIFFSDLQGFTTISENLDPDQLIQLLNDYLSAMTDIILEENGTIDKYEGDAIIAFWNAPLDTPDHAVRAVSAALRCQKRLAELRPLFQKQCGHEMHMRIGINTGAAVVGNLGSSNRFDYSMLGDAVNLAARLEGANKQFDNYTMISETTYEQINGAFPCRELALLTVVGRKKPVRVFEPFLEEEYRGKKDGLAVFAAGLNAFYIGDFETAMIKFKEIADFDPVAACYLEKCETEKGIRRETWSGVWSLNSK